MYILILRISLVSSLSGYFVGILNLYFNNKYIKFKIMYYTYIHICYRYIGRLPGRCYRCHGGRRIRNRLLHLLHWIGYYPPSTYIHIHIHIHTYIRYEQGIVRTPSAIVAMAAGKRWDDDAEEWIHYDLDYEAHKLLPVSDEVGLHTYMHAYIHHIYTIH